MRKFLILSKGENRQDIFDPILEQFKVQTLYCNESTYLKDLFSANEFSVIIFDDAGKDHVSASYKYAPLASYFYLFNDGSVEADFMDTTFTDEMYFANSKLFKGVFKKKIHRLLEERWNRKIISVLSKLIVKFPYPIIVTVKNRLKPPKVVFFNDVFIKGMPEGQRNQLEKAFDIYGYYGIEDNQNSEKSEEVQVVEGVQRYHESDLLKVVDAHIIPIRFSSRSDVEYTIAVENFRDLDEKRLQELRKNLSRERARNKAQEEFLASIAHDIRKPLNNIVGLVDLLKETNLDKEQEFISNSLNSSSKALRFLVNDLLNLSKMEAGKFQIINAYFNIRKTLSELYFMFQKEAMEKELELTMNIDPSVPAMIEGDENRLNQILINLLSNALKFTKKGRVEINIELLHISDKDTKLSMAIKDTGIGISKEEQKKIFKSYTQSSKSYGLKNEGSGLGLYICKKLVDLMKGRLLLESRLDEGSEFKLEMPFGLSAIEKVAKSEDTIKDLRGMKVLLIDDSDLTLLVLKRLLEKWKAKVITTNNGFDALQIFKDIETDIVLTDIQLPDMNGMLLAKKIKLHCKEMGENVPLIGISSFPYPHKQILENSLDDFLLKPLNSEELYLKMIELTTKELSKVEFKSNENFMDYQIIDTNHIMGFANNDKEFVKQLVEIFLQRTPEYMDELKLAVEERNWERMKKLAHKLKPTFTYVGMGSFTNKVGAIEDYAIKKDIETIKNILNDVWADCQRSFLEFDDFVKSLD